MRSTPFTAAVLLLLAVPAFGQQPSGRASATSQRESDSTFIAREWAAWDALKAGDSTAFVRALGYSPSLVMMGIGGIRHTSAAEIAGTVTKCDTRSSKLDMFNVVHPSEDTAVLTYRVALDRRCDSATGRSSGVIALRQLVMTVWVRRGNRWEAVAQSIAAMNKR